MDSARTFLRALEVFRPAFTAPTFARWLLLMAAWVLCTERHALTERLVVRGAAAVWEHSAFHRLFSRRRWDLDALARLWLAALVERLAARKLRLQFVIDDTLGTHKGPTVFGLGTHLDALRSTRKRKTFTFGHVWVTCALVVTVPFSPRPFAIPLLFRLYRSKKECALHGGDYRTKTEQARALVELLLRWLPEASFNLLLDSGDTNRAVLRGLPVGGDRSAGLRRPTRDAGQDGGGAVVERPGRAIGPRGAVALHDRDAAAARVRVHRPEGRCGLDPDRVRGPVVDGGLLLRGQTVPRAVRLAGAPGVGGVSVVTIVDGDPGLADHAG
jgi:hypothetical protein